MATPIEVKNVYEMLLDVYPSYSPRNAKRQLELWVRKFADTDVRALSAAADEHIDGSKWFPSIQELKEIVTRIGSIPEDNWLALRQEANQLEERYYLEGEFSPAAWDRLASSFERAGRPDGAARIRERATAFANVLDGAAAAGAMVRDGEAQPA